MKLINVQPPKNEWQRKDNLFGEQIQVKMTFLLISDYTYKSTLDTQILEDSITPFSLTYFTHSKQTFILRTEISLH